jgi:hypothetical protein
VTADEEKKAMRKSSVDKMGFNPYISRRIRTDAQHKGDEMTDIALYDNTSNRTGRIRATVNFLTKWTIVGAVLFVGYGAYLYNTRAYDWAFQPQTFHNIPMGDQNLIWHNIAEGGGLKFCPRYWEASEFMQRTWYRDRQYCDIVPRSMAPTWAWKQMP